MEEKSFFDSPTGGDSGAPTNLPPKTPVKKKIKTDLTGSSGKKKRRLFMEGGPGGSGDKKKHKTHLAKDPTGIINTPKIHRPLSGFNLAGRPALLQNE